MATQTIYPNSHVGFDSITSQIEKKLLKRGFQFNVICVGEYSPILSLAGEPAIDHRISTIATSLYKLTCLVSCYRPDWLGKVHSD